MQKERPTESRGQGRLRERVLAGEKGIIVLSEEVGGTPIYTCHCRYQDYVVPPQYTSCKINLQDDSCSFSCSPCALRMW